MYLTGVFMYNTKITKTQKVKAHRLIRRALTGAALVSACCTVPAMAQVTTPQPSLYDSYKLTDHPFQIVQVPDYEATPNFPSALYPDARFLSVDAADDAPYVSSTTYGDSGLNLRQALGIANETSGPNATSGQVVITVNVANYLTVGNGSIVIDNPNAEVIFKSHNFRTYQGTTASHSALTFPAIDVEAGSVLFYGTSNSPAYAEFPMKIGGTGQVHVFAFRENGPEINLTEIDGSGEFIGNRYIRINNNPGTATTPLDLTNLNLNNSSYFELGQSNSIKSNVFVNDNSTFILNGGNVLSSGEPGPNTLTGNLTIGDGNGTGNAYAVLGIQNKITGNVTVNNDGTLRGLGPTDVAGNATFANGSTFIASLGTPVNAQEFHYDSSGTGYTGTVQSPNGTTPNALTDAGNLPWWASSAGNTGWTTRYPNYKTQLIDPDSTLPGQPGYYAPPIGSYLLKVDGNITADAGSELVLDSLSSLNVGQDYIIFKVKPGSSFTNNFSITNALPALTFSTLSNDVSTIDGYTDYYVTLTGVDLSQLDMSGANKSQRSFFNYLNNLSNNPPLSPNANSSLVWIINHFNDLGPDSANSFLGNTYAAHDAQLYWNQKAFINQISDRLGSDSNLDSGHGLFSLNATGLNNVQGQLFSLRQVMDTTRLNLAGALNANASNGAADNGVWASIYGDRVNTDGDSSLGSMSWDGSTTGFAAGYTGGDSRFKWGVAAGHQKSDLNFDNLVAGADARGKVEGYNLGLYGSLNRKNTYFNGILSYSHFDNDATRTDVIGTNTSSFNSHGLAAQLEYGVHVRQTKKSDFTPYASLLWSHDNRDGITEKGTGAGLSIDSDSHNIFTSQLGVRYNYRFLDKNSDTVKGGLVAGLAWQHQFGNTDFPLTAKFNDDTSGYSFNSYGTPLSSNAFQLQLGAYGRLSRNIVGFANYRGTFGDNEKVNAVTAGLGYQF
jgi:outer membrane autotransporter protein